MPLQTRAASTSCERSSSKPTSEHPSTKDSTDGMAGGAGQKSPKAQKKTTAQADEDMKRAMEGLAGDGGEAGVELENGQPVAMKRGVRDNMFRYI